MTHIVSLTAIDVNRGGREALRHLPAYDAPVTPIRSLLYVLASMTTLVSVARAQPESLVDDWDTRLRGVRHLHRHGIDSAGIRQNIHVALVDLAHPDVEVRVVSAEGSETALELATRIGGSIAIDGDYARDGASGHPERSGLALELGRGAIARFGEVDGSVLGGGPRFMQDGRWKWEATGTPHAPRVNGEPFPEEAWVWDTGRQAHSVVALADDGRTLILFTCDGRGAGGAGGCRLQADVTPMLRDLGATDAMKLAGGPATTFVFDGQLVSRPSDPRGARPLSNALVIRTPRSVNPEHTRSEQWSPLGETDAGVDAMTPDASALPVEPRGCAAGGSGSSGAFALLTLVFVRRFRR